MLDFIIRNYLMDKSGFCIWVINNSLYPDSFQKSLVGTIRIYQPLKHIAKVFLKRIDSKIAFRNFNCCVLKLFVITTDKRWVK